MHYYSPQTIHIDSLVRDNNPDNKTPIDNNMDNKTPSYNVWVVLKLA